ncbi:membrane protein insertase YidC [Granulicella sp. L46]|uniref:membrane protein insertase YidC n=1 Tax=Granulicella sp. L46 TaxID=1641865 RepID=UPI00131AB782|nr:membrane protein insertase YidC [Granulicella sp. L46]
MPEFRNPNQGGGGGSQDNRSLFLMLIVGLGVVLGMQYWRAQKNPALESPEHPAAVTAPATAGTSSATSPTAGTSAAASATPVVVAAAQSSTTVENTLYKITFSNQGGQVTSWILKKYKDNSGHPLDMVHDGAANLYGYPLSLYTYDDGLTKQLASALYVPSATGTLQAPASLTFKYSQGNLSVTKTFTFTDTYVIHADTEVLRDGAPIRALLSWPAGLGDMETASTYVGAQIDTSSNGKTDHLSFKKISGGATLNGPFDFAALSDQYFGAVFMPDKPDDASIVTFQHKIDIAKVTASSAKGAAPASKELPILGTALGSTTGHTATSIFVGPKAVEVLKNVHTADGGNLEPLLDFGFFGPIGKYLFLGLRAVHSWIAPHDAGVHNYSWGWAIIIFTVMINVVLLPLRIQGMKSALKMQRIQPQVDAIKAKYKNPKPTDPKAAEMNAEVMAMQKANGVSMLGGCIPSLIQLPLLFAFFTMMTKVVELRQAHFFWLPDLSAADPYHILPILMVATSFLAQFYTPSPGVDPQQQKMMAFVMPLFSGYLTWQYASGLALYWNVGNLVMIATQLVMNQTSLGREMKEIAAKRARRKVAAPKPGQRATTAKTIQGRK